MNALKKLDCLSTGLALFAMFFGAGNIIFPLALGQAALNKTPWGLSGLLLTAVAMPFLGLLAMFRYEGNIQLFFGRLGKIPGLMLASFIITLLGPLGAAPRCLALAHSTLSLAFSPIPLILFSSLACLLIFLFAYKENRLLKLLGYILSPLKIGLLVIVIVKGFMEAPEATLLPANTSHTFHFLHGLKEGYNTMDLLAAFFFAPLVIASISNLKENGPSNRFIGLSCTIGASLLAIIYAGFCYLAYLYAPQLQGIPHEQLLGTLALKILGPYAGLIMSLTVAFACLTTAIALMAAFASFMEKQVLKGKASYRFILVGALLLTCLITTLEFQGIAHFLNPILKICYPVLIALTFYNLFLPLKKSKTTP